jgi:hypothetical protein
MQDWLSGFVAARMAQEAARSPHDRDWVAAAGGMHLFDSMGSVVVLRADGTVWFCDDPDEADPATWRWQQATPPMQLASLVVAARRIPELSALLPKRRPADSDCDQCQGTGKLFAIDCAACSGLGWLSDQGAT